jgi:hypothetical protein
MAAEAFHAADFCFANMSSLTFAFFSTSLYRNITANFRIPK